LGAGDSISPPPRSRLFSSAAEQRSCRPEKDRPHKQIGQVRGREGGNFRGGWTWNRGRFRWSARWVRKLETLGWERNASNLGATEWREFNRALLCAALTPRGRLLPSPSAPNCRNKTKGKKKSASVSRSGETDNSPSVRPSTCHGDVGCFALTWFRCAGRPRTDLAPPCLSGPSSEIAQTAPWIMDELCH
jgi:hypothetical protein